jgi:hypothetical protein
MTTTTRHITGETPATYTYCGITAAPALWAAVGLTTTNWVGGITEFPRREDHPFGGSRAATDGEIIEARVTTGDTGDAALVWLIAERRRQREETARNAAQHALANAVKAAEEAIHAARIHRQAEDRQAEELRCKAMGVRP